MITEQVMPFKNYADWKSHCEYMECLWRLHTRAIEKLKVISKSEYYTVFGSQTERVVDMKKANDVAERIYEFIIYKTFNY